MQARLYALQKDTKIVVVNGAVAGGTTTVTPSAAIDMTGFESVAFIAVLGDVVDTAVVTLKTNEVASNTTTGGTAVSDATATFTATATSADNKALISEVIRPRTRYVYPTLERTIANAPVNAILAVLHGSTEHPVTLDSSVIAAALAAGN